MDNSQHTKDRINSFVNRANNIEESIKDLRIDLAEVFKEAKDDGYDVSTIKKVIKLLRKDAGELEQDDLFEKLYREAVGI
ncbi:MAG: DUF2312 domain-containing protein [Candidatus Hodarchaeales archaeon]